MIDLIAEPCPFCGSTKLKIDSKNGPIHYYEKNGMTRWQRVVYSVRCKSCHARGSAVGIDIPILPVYNDIITIRKKTGMEGAVKAWNERIQI